jgi:uncharacterized protein (TIGR02444 family)
MALNLPANEFWDFSVKLYGAPGVAPACLALQERHGLDVNALMFCVWLGASGRGPVEPARLADAFAAAEAWHAEIVRALRAIRKRLKSPVGPVDVDLAMALRARIQKIEIDAEHIEQLTLATRAGGLVPRARDPDARAEHAARHCAAYFVRIGATPGQADLGDLKIVIGAALALPEPAVRAHLDKAFAEPGETA